MSRKTTSEEIAFGELVLTDVSRADAAAEIWPDLKYPAHKASRVFQNDAFIEWYRARKEITEQNIREITARHKADYESRIEALAEAFGDPETKWREKLQIHDKLTIAEGRKVTRQKADALDTNRLAQLVAGAAAFGAGVGPRLLDGRLPAIRRELPLDTDKRRGPAEVQPVATPAADVERPPRTDTEQ